MTITAFQMACHKHKISTSFCATRTDNIVPAGVQTQKMIIRLWKDNGEKFSFERALQDASVVFDSNRSITYPNQEQLEKLDEKVRDCASKLLSCLEKEPLPLTQQKVKDILGNTVVILLDEFQQETELLSSQTI